MEGGHYVQFPTARQNLPYLIVSSPELLLHKYSQYPPGRWVNMALPIAERWRSVLLPSLFGWRPDVSLKTQYEPVGQHKDVADEQAAGCRIQLFRPSS